MVLIAMMHVETDGNWNKPGDDGKSIGPLQISYAYYKDAWGYNRRLKPSEERMVRVLWRHAAFNWDSAVGTTHRYMKRYCTAKRIGRTPTVRDAVRIHNGGPNGWKKPSTVRYWRKVEAKYMELWGQPIPR